MGGQIDEHELRGGELIGDAGAGDYVDHPQGAPAQLRYDMVTGGETRVSDATAAKLDNLRPGLPPRHLPLVRPPSPGGVAVLDEARAFEEGCGAQVHFFLPYNVDSAFAEQQHM